VKVLPEDCGSDGGNEIKNDVERQLRRKLKKVEQAHCGQAAMRSQMPVQVVPVSSPFPDRANRGAA
jgi:hypothetical protein